jgi:hypothetical protein
MSPATAMTDAPCRVLCRPSGQSTPDSGNSAEHPEAGGTVPFGNCTRCSGARLEEGNLYGPCNPSIDGDGRNTSEEL